MALHAGFASVATATEQYVNQALQVYWNQFAPPIPIPLPATVQVGQTPVSIAGAVALAAPKVSLSFNQNNTVPTDFAFVGALSLQSGLLNANFEVVLHARVDLGLVALPVAGQIVAGLDLSTATVNAINVFVISGGECRARFRLLWELSPFSTPSRRHCKAFPAKPSSL